MATSVIHLFKKYTCVCASVSICATIYTHVCGVPQMSEEAVRSFGTGATGICEQSDTGSGILTLVLMIKWQVCLTPEPSPQPQTCLLHPAS